MDCKVESIGNHTLLWRFIKPSAKEDDEGEILTAGLVLVSSDARLQVLHEEGESGKWRWRQGTECEADVCVCALLVPLQLYTLHLFLAIHAHISLAPLASLHSLHPSHEVHSIPPFSSEFPSHPRSHSGADVDTTASADKQQGTGQEICEMAREGERTGVSECS